MIYPDYVLNFQVPINIFKDALKEYQKGAELLELENYIGAIEKFMAAIEIDPKFAYSYVDWGVALLCWGVDTSNSDKLEEAIDKFKICIEVVEHDNIITNILAYYNWGSTLIELERHGDAIEKFESCLKIDDKYIGAFFKWGNALIELGRYEGAIERFEKCKMIDIDYVDAYHNIAYILNIQGRYKEANLELENAYIAYEHKKQEAKDTKDVEFFSSFGSLLCCSLDKMEYAEETYKEGLTFDPDNIDILIGIFHLYIVRGEEDEAYYWKAKDIYKKAETILLKLPESTDNLIKLGYLYQEMEEYGKAENVLLKGLRKDTKSATLFSDLGDIYLYKENFDKAIQYFKDAEIRDPDNLDIKSKLAESYLKNKLLEKAEIEYNKILNITTFHVASSIGLGEVYLAMGENSDDEYMYDRAISCFTDTIKTAKSENASNIHYIYKEKELANAYYLRGYAKVKLNNLHGAKKDFIKCLEYDSDNHKARHHKEKIEKFINPFSHQILMEKIGPGIIFISSIIVLIINQFIYIYQFFDRTKYYIDIVYYTTITFVTLIFVIIGIYLPQILKLKIAGIEIEKGITNQITTHKMFDIKR